MGYENPDDAQDAVAMAADEGEEAADEATS